MVLAAAPVVCQVEAAEVDRPEVAPPQPKPAQRLRQRQASLALAAIQ